MTVTKTNSPSTSTPTVDNITGNKKEEDKTRKREELLNNEDDITLADRAPDGGWGWVIALAMIFTYLTTIGQIMSFNLIFGDFIQASGQAVLASNLFHAFFMISYFIACLVTNTLLKRYSTRPVGIAGALLFAIQNIMRAFVRNIFDMAFLFLIQGFGMGLIITVCYTVFNAYFVKKRTKVMSVAQVFIALGGIIYPKLIGKLKIVYDFRGTAAIIGAISLNGIIGMALMHPVERHLRNIDVVRAEKAREKEEKCQELALSSQRHSTISGIESEINERSESVSMRENLTRRMSTLSASSVANLATSVGALSDIRQQYLKEQILEDQTNKETLKERENEKENAEEKQEESKFSVASISGIESEICERSESVSMPENLTSGMSTLSASSVANLATSVGALGDIRQQYLEEQILEDQTNEETLKEKENEKENAEEKQKESKYKKFVKELLDMSLVKNWAFLNICFGVCFVSTADFDFSSFLPLITTKLGYTAQETELTVWINGIAELVSRVLLVSFTMIVDVKPKYLFFAGMILMGFAKLGFLLCEHTLKGVLITTALIGFVRAWLLVSQSIVIIDDVSIEKFASAYGFFGMISCLLSLTCSATVGLIITGNYDMYQVFLLVLQCTFIIPWALQFIFVHLRERRRPHAQNIII